MVEILSWCQTKSGIPPQRGSLSLQKLSNLREELQQDPTGCVKYLSKREKPRYEPAYLIIRPEMGKERKENLDFHDRYYCTIKPETIALCNHSVTIFHQLVAARQ
jgi:hypothetical protein